MGNGARAAQRRERNATQKQSAGGKSSRKTDEAAKTIVCKICFQSFLQTARAPALTEHANNKHNGKSGKECFPDYPFPP